MKIFKQYLTEFRSNIPQSMPLNQQNLIDLIGDSKLLHIQFTIKSQKAITAYEYDGFGIHDKFIILTDRIDKSDIVGYMWLNNSISNKKYWQVRDVTIYDPYKNQGLGYDLYIKIINEGYALINGFSLSTVAEKVWRKLSNHVNVYTWNKETDQITDFSEKPKEDNNIEDDKQQYFWLATTKNNSLKESLTNKSGDTYHWYLEWLNGSIKTPGSFSTFKYGEYGEF